MKKIIKNQNGGSAPTGTQSWFQTYGGNIASNLLDKFPLRFKGFSPTYIFNI